MSTVITTLRQLDYTPAASVTVTFYPALPPWVRTQGIFTGTPVVAATNSVGFMSTPLVGGNYTVQFGDDDPLPLSLPDDDLTYALSDIVPAAAGTINVNYRENGIYFQLINNTNGTMHTIRAAGNQVQIDGAGVTTGDGNFRWTGSTELDLYNSAAGGWQCLYWDSTSGTPRLGIKPVGVAMSGNARIKNGAFQLVDIAGGYRTTYISGTYNQLTPGPVDLT